MGLIDWLARVEHPLYPRAHIYTALVRAGENDPHNCIFYTHRSLDGPVVLQNKHAFQMPADLSFVETDHRTVKWGDRTADVHEIIPTDDPDGSDHRSIDLPEEAIGIWYPEEFELTEEKWTQISGEA